MPDHHEEAAKFIEEKTDPRKRAFLSFGMTVAIMDVGVANSDARGFDVLTLVKILDRMFDKPQVLKDVLYGDIEEQAWFSDDPI